jgi:hypothetical protein
MVLIPHTYRYKCTWCRVLDQLIEVGGVVSVSACAELGGWQGLLIRTAAWGLNITLYANPKALTCTSGNFALWRWSMDGCRPVMLQCA